ncbi:Chemotaxis protein methyltransferase Cher2 (plasmid) [Rhodovastum atsumiense]|uniref:CheR family methyltransferase n=1 Tax=Rhodovastum atsumiense TaxID=504468 RepID=UPI002024A9D0|nr:protein-glutamate O-methyltransferase CheR [Rhodovastum atsumiense]CAH2605460.1 Chemotaxis protein methyltransferase Cher2 [Rhodovastum atsumiense]
MSAAAESLRSFVRSRAGISMGPDKDYLVTSRLEPQLASWGLHSLDSLAEAVRRQPSGALAEKVVAALTTNETLWFRDGRPFEAFRNVVLPDVAKDGSISIWSAACSTGQEVYSIAITLREEEARLRGCRSSILGSDICEPALVRARAGTYTAFEVQRGLSPAMLSRHFLADGDGWRIRPELRTNVSFRVMNLLELPAGLGPFDVVFCRNVLIYFEVDVKARVLAAIAARVRPGGWLFLGGAETTMGLTTAFTAVPGITGLYRRV